MPIPLAVYNTEKIKMVVALICDSDENSQSSNLNILKYSGLVYHLL